MVCLVEGGNRQVGSDKELVLDGSSSLDYDNLDYLPFSYNWRCDFAPPSNGPCKDSRDRLLQFPRESELRYPPASLVVGEVYIFMLTVMKGSVGAPRPNGYREAVANVNVEILAGSPPVVVINPPAMSRKIQLGVRGALTSAYKVNPSQSLTVSSTVESLQAELLTVMWSQLDGDFDMSDPTTYFLTPLDRQLVKLRPDVLTPGSRYNFQFIASDPNGDASANIYFIVNKAPTSGYVKIEPSSGFALDTEFKFTAVDWTDDVDDYPFEYSYRYILGTQTSTTTASSEKALTSAPIQKPSLEGITLPQGVGSNRTITMVLYIQVQSLSFSLFFSSNLSSPLIHPIGNLPCFSCHQVQSLSLSRLF